MRLDLTLDQLENTVFCAKYRNFKRKLVRKMTKMTSSEIDCALMLHYKFVLAHKERRNQYMTPSQLADFYQIYFHMPNFNFVQEVIKYVDPSSKGAISAEGFVRLIEIWIYGSFADRMKFCFAVSLGCKRTSLGVLVSFNKLTLPRSTTIQRVEASSRGIK